MEWYDWFFDCVKNKYSDFDGRARRKEYWLYTLMMIIINIILQILVGVLSFIPLINVLIWIVVTIIGLGLIVPSLAVTVRRLHDTGKSGWWVLLAFIPVVCLVLLYFLVLDSQHGSNRYGDNPKGE